MQNILQKHETENRLMAEQLLAFKQQLIESDTFEQNNVRFKGFRFGSFGAKTEALLYFTEERTGQNQSEANYYLMLTYGSGNAVKVDLTRLDEFYIVEGTQQI